MNELDAQGNAHDTRAGIRFDRLEWAGAFGDLGTLIPFVTAYVAVLGMDPRGILLSFGIACVAVGWYYRTPFPVQPMKAIGAAAASQAAHFAVLTPAAVYSAGLVTGVAWLALGFTGTARRISRMLTRPVSLGIIMGLGLSLGLDGIRMMSGDWLLAAIALAMTFLLLANRAIPVMFLLLLFGAVASAVKTPELFQAVAAMHPAFGLPEWTLAQIGWRDLAIGALVLALPQLPLTLGNAIIGITEENNRLFPDRRTTENRVALSTGVMNILAPQIGGVPMCHGAGGMAGHVAFGARTGGATIIVGAVLVLLALFFGGSVATLLKVFPPAVLGVILFVTGIQLALGGTCDLRKTSKPERFIHIATAAFALWNIGIAFLVGVVLQELHRRKLLHI